MGELSFWWIFIIIPLVCYGLYKILSIMPYSLVEKLLGAPEHIKNQKVMEETMEFVLKTKEIQNLKSQLRGYGLTSEEIDNYIIDKKEDTRVSAIELGAQLTFNEVGALENLIQQYYMGNLKNKESDIN